MTRARQRQFFERMHTLCLRTSATLSEAVVQYTTYQISYPEQMYSASVMARVAVVRSKDNVCGVSFLLPDLAAVIAAAFNDFASAEFEETSRVIP